MDKILANRYQVIEKLGQGGMGEVYKGLDTQTEADVAIKRLRGNISDDTAVIARFQREAQALRDLNHPNIVQLLDMIHEDGEYYLITEYIDGGDLADLLKARGRLAVEETLKIGLEIADALSRTHHLGVIHRDIKPANVLMAADGTPRLTDFGVAHMESEERLTGTGMAFGTVDYLPPEAIAGEPVDARADVWSFGVLLYEMLMGERPFKGASVMLVMTSIVQDTIPNLQDELPDVPPALNELIHLMLQKDRNLRMRSVRQVAAALEAILQGDDSSLQYLKTPSAGISQAPALLEDAPTTPAGIQVSPKLPTSRVKAETDPVPTQRSLSRWLIPIVIVVIIGAALGLSLIVTIEPEATNTPTATVTPEPSPTLAPITGDAPEGYQWVAVDEVRMLVPNSWTSIPIDSFLQMGASFFEDNESLTYAATYLEQQRAKAIYGNLINFSGFGIMIEDTDFLLPESVVEERLVQLVMNGLGEFVQEPEWIETRLGRTLFAEVSLMAVGNSSNRSTLEMYIVSRGTTLYALGSSIANQELDTESEVFDTIFASIEIGEPILPTETATFTPEPSNTPEPSPTLVQTNDDAPTGYRWVDVAEVRLLVPRFWASIPSDTFLAVGENFITNDESYTYVFDYLEQQREIAIYGNLLDLSGLAVMIEDTDIIMPASMLPERIQQFLDIGGTVNFIQEPTWVETDLGQALFAEVRMQGITDSGGDNITELYLFQRGTLLYAIGFSSLADNHADNRELFDTIFASIEIGEPAPTATSTPEPTATVVVEVTDEAVEMTPEAETTIVLENMPEGWQVATGEYTAFAVPHDILTTRGSNSTLLNASMQLIMGNLGDAERVGSLFDQMHIDALAAQFQGADLFFVSTIYQDNVLTVDLETAASLTEGMFEIVGDNEDVEIIYGENTFVTIPAGDAIRAEMQMIVGDRPSFRAIYYLLVGNDGAKMYAISFAFLDSETERKLPLIEQIVETFVILE